LVRPTLTDLIKPCNSDYWCSLGQWPLETLSVLADVVSKLRAFFLWCRCSRGARIAGGTFRLAVPQIVIGTVKSESVSATHGSLVPERGWPLPRHSVPHSLERERNSVGRASCPTEPPTAAPRRCVDSGSCPEPKDHGCRFSCRCKLNCTKCFAGIAGCRSCRFLYFSLPHTRPGPVKNWSCPTSAPVPGFPTPREQAVADERVRKYRNGPWSSWG